jgi:murein hydrolase activator
VRGVAGRVATLALGLVLAGATARAGDREAELEALRSAIEQSRVRVEAFEREQRGLLDAIEGIDRAASALDRELRLRQREAESSAAALRDVQGRVETLESSLERTRAAMAARAVALYETGEVGPAQVLFAARSLRDLLERVAALRLLLAHDRTLVVRFRREREELEASRARLTASSERHERALAEVRARSGELTRERAAKQRLAASVRSDRTRERAALVELEAAARALEETLARLGTDREPAPPTAQDFASLRGRLPAPVDAAVARPFGRDVDAEFHTQVFRKGIDFAADPGEPVRAVAPGRVRFAGWFRGYGRMVILDHGAGFFTVSGHLDEIRVEVDEDVDGGEAIGTVGDTGSLAGPGLYFEIRRGGEALDPALWLAPG